MAEWFLRAMAAIVSKANEKVTVKVAGDNLILRIFFRGPSKLPV